MNGPFGSLQLSCSASATMMPAQQGQLVTIYEAEVAPEQCTALRQAYAAALARGLPPEVLQTFLIPGQEAGLPWRLVVVWGSQEALAAYRDTAVLPGFARFRRRRTPRRRG